MPSRRSTAALVTAGALLLGACGGSTPTATGGQAGAASTLPGLDGSQPPASSGGAPAPAPGVSVLPDLVVDDVTAGTKVNLASFTPSPTPLLVWFWAPH